MENRNQKEDLRREVIRSLVCENAGLETLMPAMLYKFVEKCAKLTEEHSNTPSVKKKTFLNGRITELTFVVNTLAETLDMADKAKEIRKEIDNAFISIFSK